SSLLPPAPRAPRTARPESCGNRSANATRGSRTGSGLPPLNLAQPPLEKSALGVIGDQREGSRIALRRFLRGSETEQQIGARGMQQMITVELAAGGERIDERERRPRAVRHRDRRRAVQGHDGGGLLALEELVEPDDLRPVRVFDASRLAMQ